MESPDSPTAARRSPWLHALKSFAVSIVTYFALVGLAWNSLPPLPHSTLLNAGDMVIGAFGDNLVSYRMDDDFTASRGGKVSIWDLQDGVMKRSIPVVGAREPWCHLMTPTVTWWNETDNSLWILNASTGKQGKLDHFQRRPDFSISQNGRWLMITPSAGEPRDKPITLYNLELMTKSNAWEKVRPTVDVDFRQFSEVGNFLEIFDKTSKRWRVYDPAAGRFVIEPLDLQKVTYSPDGGRIASIDAKLRPIQIIDVKTGKTVQTLQTDDDRILGELTFSPDGKLLAVREKDKKAPFNLDFRALTVWNVETGKKVRETVFTQKVRDWGSLLVKTKYVMIEDQGQWSVEDIFTGECFGPWPARYSLYHIDEEMGRALPSRMMIKSGWGRNGRRVFRECSRGPDYRHGRRSSFGISGRESSSVGFRPMNGGSAWPEIVCIRCSTPPRGLCAGTILLADPTNASPLCR